ncbi:MAG: hypothetical protein HY363_03850 [Candidatus Aenigmarchaeota archaeon]|nr:hypothetical protein [Candidatus Aenigmarchaeota archaeon]
MPFKNLEAAIERNDYLLFDTNTTQKCGSLNGLRNVHVLRETENTELNDAYEYLTRMLDYYANSKTIFIPEVVAEVRYFEKHLRNTKKWFETHHQYVLSPDALTMLKQYVSLVSRTHELQKKKAREYCMKDENWIELENLLYSVMPEKQRKRSRHVADVRADSYLAAQAYALLGKGNVCIVSSDKDIQSLVKSTHFIVRFLSQNEGSQLLSHPIEVFAFRKEKFVQTLHSDNRHTMSIQRFFAEQDSNFHKFKHLVFQAYKILKPVFGLTKMPNVPLLKKCVESQLSK